MKKLRTEYFQHISQMVTLQDCQFVVLTHILEDRPEFLSALNSIAPVALVIAIPYSIHNLTYQELQKTYNLKAPTLEQLRNADFLRNILNENLVENKPVIILEIGGYFAKVLVKGRVARKIIGVIEDTETGHREYEKERDKLQFPVISVARSSLKSTEDHLVGPSCIYSIEKLLRKAGLLIEGKRSLILGFGKVGRGLAHALYKKHCPVAIYDIDPTRLANALSEGFQVPSKKNAFKDAEIIYGATGTNSITEEDFPMIKNGAILASCGSKDTEFDVLNLTKNYAKEFIVEHLDKYKNKDHFFYLAADGRPVNFIDGAVIGPALTLTQAEIILAINDVLKLHKEQKYGLFETSHETKKMLAHKWLQCFCDEFSGRYKHI